jgi:hypothetical protein
MVESGISNIWGLVISTPGALALRSSSRDGRTTFSLSLTSGSLMSTAGMSIGGCSRSIFTFVGGGVSRSIPGMSIFGLKL